MNDFVHLHNHSHYSLQDAACTVDSLIKSAVKNNMKALALTDHGVMFGASEFSKKAKKAGIKPILGVEAYIVKEGSRFDRGEDYAAAGRGRKKIYNHIVLLAKNKAGYKNLLKLTSLAHTEGFYYKPRIDMELLRENHDGIICTSACLAGPVSSHLVSGNFDKAKETAIIYKELFGDDFYLEIQNHGLEGDEAVLEGMPRLSKELGIKIIATNDIHYIEKEHAIAHNILLHLGDKSGSVDYKQLRYGVDEFYFKSGEDMKEIFKDFPDAIENTLEIAEKIDFDLEFSGFHYPDFPIPENSNAKNLDEYFKQLAEEGLHQRFSKITKEIEDRFKYEIDVIQSMGYSGYFLIVQDFINAAKNMGIPVGPGRGSAAGSLVAFALGITNVDPLKYNLLFERFLNPARKSMPDIDVDFADDQRGDVIDYTKNKYGEQSVCQIITFNRLSSRQVLKDVGRVLQMPIPKIEAITKWIPSEFGKVYSIDRAIKEVPELKWLRDNEDPEIERLLKYARILEGMNRNASKHAAGVVIAPGSVSDYVPLARAGSSGDIVTQYNMKELDDAGMLKMDFLGLRTLTIIRDAIDLVKNTRGIEIDIDAIPVDDERTYKLFALGRTTAIFQFESSPMKEYLKKLHPTSISDLAAMNALYRPGPMKFIDKFIARKFGREKIEYLHPYLEEILKETYGIIVYQEQVIQIANKIAGMSLAEADILRRAMGKKDAKVMAEQKVFFLKSAKKNGIPEKVAKEIMENIVEFANYGFNKSHAVAYSIVAYQTAYLKAHYLPEFLAANLTNEFGNADKVSTLLDDCRKMHVPVLSPDINKPSVTFSVENGKIIFGMSAIKNVGKNAVEEIIRARNEIDGDFTSLYDFCMSIDTRVINKRALEGLVLAGALDSVKGSRAQNFSIIEDALSFGSKAKAAKDFNENSLFADSESDDLKIIEPELPDIPMWDVKTRLAREREVLGFYLSGHPLSPFVPEFESFATVHLGEQETFENKEYIRACGVITDMRTKIDRAGNMMAFFKMDDFTGSAECLCFSKIYRDYGKYIETEATILVKAKPESSGDEIKLHIDEVIPLIEAKRKLSKRVVLYLHSDTHSPEDVLKLKSLLENEDGNIPVIIRVVDSGSKRNFVIEKRINISDETVEQVKKILGDEAIRYSVV